MDSQHEEYVGVVDLTEKEGKKRLLFVANSDPGQSDENRT
jgi:hypothetical protein